VFFIFYRDIKSIKMLRDDNPIMKLICMLTIVGAADGVGLAVSAMIHDLRTVLIFTLLHRHKNYTHAAWGSSYVPKSTH
jgi:hypothetical protein